MFICVKEKVNGFEYLRLGEYMEIKTLQRDDP